MAPAHGGARPWCETSARRGIRAGDEEAWRQRWPTRESKDAAEPRAQARVRAASGSGEAGGRHFARRRASWAETSARRTLEPRRVFESLRRLEVVMAVLDAPTRQASRVLSRIHARSRAETSRNARDLIASASPRGTARRINSISQCRDAEDIQTPPRTCAPLSTRCCALAHWQPAPFDAAGFELLLDAQAAAASL